MLPVVRAVARIVVSLAVLASSTSADSWVRYGVQRHNSPNGLHGIVVDGRAFQSCGKESAPLRVVRRPEGAPAPPTGQGEAPEELLDAHDEVFATITSPQIPDAAFVLDDGRFVIVDSYGSNGQGDLVRVHEADGALRHALSAFDVFDEETWGSFGQSVSSVWWREDAWVDTATERVVLLARGARLRVVSLSSGDVDDVPASEVLIPRFSSSADEGGRIAALDAAIQLGLPGVLDAIAEVLHDEDQPLGLRVRVATVAHRAGRPVPLDCVDEALSSNDAVASWWAWRHLVEFVGAEAALPRLLAGARGAMMLDGPVRQWAVEALAVLGEPARRAVVGAQLEAAQRGDEMELKRLADTLDALEFDAERLAARPLDDRPAWMDDFSQVPRDWDKILPTDVASFIALVRDGEPASLDHLLAWRPQKNFRPMDHRTSPFALATLAHLQQHAMPAAGQALVRFLEEARRHEHMTEGWKDLLLAEAREALVVLVGEDCGFDPEAWLERIESAGQ